MGLFSISVIGFNFPHLANKTKRNQSNGDEKQSWNKSCRMTRQRCQQRNNHNCRRKIKLHIEQRQTLAKRLSIGSGNSNNNIAEHPTRYPKLYRATVDLVMQNTVEPWGNPNTIKLRWTNFQETVPLPPAVWATDTTLQQFTLIHVHRAPLRNWPSGHRKGNHIPWNYARQEVTMRHGTKCSKSRACRVWRDSSPLAQGAWTLSRSLRRDVRHRQKLYGRDRARRAQFGFGQHHEDREGVGNPAVGIFQELGPIDL